MSEKSSRIIYFILGVAAVWAAVTAGLWLRGTKYKRQLETARLELEQVRRISSELAERQQSINRNLERARTIVERQSDSLSGAVETLADLRNCIARIRSYTEALEDCLRGGYRINGANNSSSGGDSCESLKRP